MLFVFGPRHPRDIRRGRAARPRARWPRASFALADVHRSASRPRRSTDQRCDSMHGLRDRISEHRRAGRCRSSCACEIGLRRDAPPAALRASAAGSCPSAASARGTRRAACRAARAPVRARANRRCPRRRRAAAATMSRRVVHRAGERPRADDDVDQRHERRVAHRPPELRSRARRTPGSPAGSAS